MLRLEQDRFHVIIELPAGRDTREQLTENQGSGGQGAWPWAVGSSDENLRYLKHATVDRALPLSTQGSSQQFADEETKPQRG